MQGTPLNRKKSILTRALLCTTLFLLAHSAAVFGFTFNIPIVSLTNHNTSANPAYNFHNFSANFGPTSAVNTVGGFINIDSNKMDMSLNPVTPGHVSKTDVHNLIPSRRDLRWFAHATPWFGTSSHIDIGLNNNTTAYVAAMITDMENRGFNGVVINWYGSSDVTDGVTQKIKSYLASNPTNKFSYVLMLDKGLKGTGNLAMQNLTNQIVYCQNQYFSDPNYEHEPTNGGQPILMFFGVRSAIGQSNMAYAKAATGENMVWVEENTNYFNESWEDETFQWTDDFGNGVSSSDPFNLHAVTNEFSAIASNGKKAFGAMCSQFNGTLTKSVGWSLGKYLPGSNGLCEVQRASAINAAIPANMTRMQWPTWSDWEEGTAVEAGIENNFSVSALVNGANILTWNIISGDEHTIDHYEIYASSNNINAALLGIVANGTHSFNVGAVGLSPGNYQFYVDAIGKPCIRDHMTAGISVILQEPPQVTRQPADATSSAGGSANFNAGVTGTPPFTFTWYDQNNSIVGTSSNLLISPATQNNSYFVAVSNQYGGTLSASANLTVLTAPVVLTDISPLSQVVWQRDQVTFSVVAGGAAPFSYQWTLNSQNISDATNASYTFAALAGTNDYQVIVTNNSGSTNSSTAVVVGVPGTFPNTAHYNGLKITFSGYTSNETLVDFPVLVRLSTNVAGFSYSQFASPATGSDLRFIGENGRELPYEIDQWNPNGESLIWVQVPSISSNTDYITAVWGNTADSGVQPWNTNGMVWSTLSGSNDFTLVYHLSQSNFPIADSTLQFPATSGVAPSPTIGVIGNALAFNGTSQFIDSGLVPVTKTFTVSAWVNISLSASSEQTIWCNKQGGWNVAGFDFYVNSFQTSDGEIYFDSADGVGGNVSPRTVANAVTFGQWHLLTGTMDGVNGAVHVYVDGVDKTVNTGVDTAFQVTNYVRCGGLLTGTPGATGGLTFNGLMDETRFESGIRSPAWVWASWATVAQPNFATFGNVVLQPVTLLPQMVNGQLILNWTVGTLQSAPSVAGPYSDVVGASSPYPVPASSAQQYFRIRIQ